MNRFEDYYRYGEKMLVHKGEHIYDSMDEHYAYFLHSGICALSSIKKNGVTKTHLYFMDQRVIGFAHFTRHLYTQHRDLAKNALIIIAKTNCIVYRLDSEVLCNLMKTDLLFTNLLFEVLSENYQNIFLRYLQMEEESVPIRVCMFLMDYAIEKQGQYILPKFFTQSEIAEYLNIHTVTLSRVMSSLKQLHCVCKQDHHLYIIQPSMIKAIIHKEIELTY